MIKLFSRLLKITGLIIIILSTLFLAQCIYSEVSQRDNLLRLCENISSGSAVSDALARAQKGKFEIRSESLRSNKERDWFNRQYDRFLEAFRKNNNIEESLTIIFAKPGVGFYACIIEHGGDSVMNARYLDRSS